jgi:hypothetical protein
MITMSQRDHITGRIEAVSDGDESRSPTLARTLTRSRAAPVALLLAAAGSHCKDPALTEPVAPAPSSVVLPVQPATQAPAVSEAPVTPPETPEPNSEESTPPATQNQIQCRTVFPDSNGNVIEPKDATPLPPCPDVRATRADCKAAGSHFHARSRTCVSECLGAEKLVDNECCIADAAGKCCRSGMLDADGACFTPPPSPPPSFATCPRDRPIRTCHPCVCSPP